MHQIRFIQEFIKVVIEGLLSIFNRIWKIIIAIHRQLPVIVRYYFISAVISILLLVQPWMDYQVPLSGNKEVSHIAFTDDFLLFFIFLGMLSFFVILSKYIFQKWVTLTYLFSIAIIVFLYIINIYDSSRITEAKEAHFSFSFFFFGIFMIISGITGFLGIKNYAQKSLR